MAEYIEREAAIRHIKENKCSKCSDIGLCGNCAVLISMKLFEAIPAADVVPVVRCGECKFRVYGWCSPHNIWRGENFFCADGERKNGDGE